MYMTIILNCLTSFQKQLLSCVMRKPEFGICENKDADQLRGDCEADQRLCFRYTDSTIPLLSESKIFKPLAIFCDCPVGFVSDLVGNPKDQFSHNEAQITLEHPWIGGTKVYLGYLGNDRIPLFTKHSQY